jgi:hypothetical protein
MRPAAFSDPLSLQPLTVADRNPTLSRDREGADLQATPASGSYLALPLGPRAAESAIFIIGRHFE